MSKGVIHCIACGGTYVLSPLYEGLVSLVRHTCPKRRKRKKGKR